MNHDDNNELENDENLNIRKQAEIDEALKRRILGMFNSFLFNYN